MSSVLLFFAVLIFSFWWFNYWKNYSSIKRHLPLPPTAGPALPFLGHLHKIDGKDFFGSICRLHRQYGDIFMLKLGNRPTVVVNSVKLAQEASSKDGLMDKPRLKMWEDIRQGSSINKETAGEGYANLSH